MSQNLIEADFTKGKKPVYLTNRKSYAEAQQDEWRTITGDKYVVEEIKLYAVVPVKES